jgi:hypothetical protein
MISNPAPIVLFVYNRPWHTLQLLNSLKKDNLAPLSTLFIFADGPKKCSSKELMDNITQVREIIRQEKWCREVVIKESRTNNGLADSILKGVNDIIAKFGKVIVLEDDLILSEGFLTYMNSALNFYEHEEKVMHISGYIPPLKARLPETFFLNNTTCHGWATWYRAWKYLNLDIDFLISEISKDENLEKFNKDGVKDFFIQLQLNQSGVAKTWAIFWQASVFLRNGLCLHPNRSLVNNIGYDGSGVHCRETNAYFHRSLAENITIKKIPLYESDEALRALKNFYISLVPHWQDRLLIHINSRLPKPIKIIYRKIKNNLVY